MKAKKILDKKEVISIRDGEMYSSAIGEDYCRWTGHEGLMYLNKRYRFMFEAHVLITDVRFWDDSFQPLTNLKRVKFLKEPIRFLLCPRGGFSKN